MLEDFKFEVFEANQLLHEQSWVLPNGGWVSGYDPVTDSVVLPPNAVPFRHWRWQDMIVVDREGVKVEGRFRPTLDMPLHCILYRTLENLGGVCHAHGLSTCAFAQARQEICCFGSMHAEQFGSHIPVTAPLPAKGEQISFEQELARLVAQCLEAEDAQPQTTRAVLIARDAPVTWGRSPLDAVQTMITLEGIAAMALQTLKLAPKTQPMDARLIERYQLRRRQRELLDD